MPHELSKTYDLRKLVNIRKISKLHKIISVQSSSGNKNFVSISKNLLKNRSWIFPIEHYSIWNIEFASNIVLMTVGISRPTWDKNPTRVGAVTAWVGVLIANTTWSWLYRVTYSFYSKKIIMLSEIYLHLGLGYLE